MRIAVLGSAPSSVHRAPFGDPSWQIWACSPGAYPVLPRVDEFWEVHRWEPGVVGKAATQKPWFSPEYVMWLKTFPPKVWVSDPAAKADIGERAHLLPIEELVTTFGHYVWTSSVAYMLGQAALRIMAARAAGDAGPHAVGLWGVDMAANEELYSGQRSACQFFLQVLRGMKIDLHIPPESDLAVPPPMYGVAETSHRAIKFMERKRELEQRLANANASADSARMQAMFIQGAIDDLQYHQTMWLHEGDAMGFDFDKVFPALADKT